MPQFYLAAIVPNHLAIAVCTMLFVEGIPTKQLPLRNNKHLTAIMCPSKHIHTGIRLAAMTLAHVQNQSKETNPCALN